MPRRLFIKISGVFGTGFEPDADKQRVSRHVVALAHDFGCATVLEGIESRATADAAASMGIELAQGYFFSIPRDVSHWTAVTATIHLLCEDDAHHGAAAQRAFVLDLRAGSATRLTASAVVEESLGSAV